LLLWSDFNLISLCTSLENMDNKYKQNADLLQFHENHSCPSLVLYRQKLSSLKYSAFSLQETADSAQYEEKVAHTGWKERLATHILL